MTESSRDTCNFDAGDGSLRRRLAGVLLLGGLLVLGFFLPVLVTKEEPGFYGPALVPYWSACFSGVLKSSWAAYPARMLICFGPAAIGCIVILASLYFGQRTRARGITLVVLGGGYLMLLEVLFWFLGNSHIVYMARGPVEVFYQANTRLLLIAYFLLWVIYLLGWTGVLTSFRVRCYGPPSKAVRKLGLIGGCCLLGACLLPVDFGPHGGALYVWRVPWRWLFGEGWPSRVGFALEWLPRFSHLLFIVAAAMLAIVSARGRRWASRLWAVRGVWIAVSGLLLLALVKSRPWDWGDSDLPWLREPLAWARVVCEFCVLLLLLPVGISDIVLSAGVHAPDSEATVRRGVWDELRFAIPQGRARFFAGGVVMVLTLGICLGYVFYGEREPMPQLTAPTIHPPGGHIKSPVEVTIHSDEPGAVIRFTLDGFVPSLQSPQYVQPIEIVAPMTITARSFKAAYLPSSIVSADFNEGHDPLVPQAADTWDEGTVAPIPTRQPDSRSNSGSASAADAPQEEPNPVTFSETDLSANVVIDTSLGRIVVQLDGKRTPNTVANFLQYVSEEFYDNTIFHRVIPGFMIQGGGLAPDYVEKPTRGPIKNEAHQAASNGRGSIAIARKKDADSATCQFYINLKDNRNLDTFAGGYCVFGRVIDGMDVVDAIAGVATTEKRITQRGGGSMSARNAPVETILIRSIRRE